MKTLALMTVLVVTAWPLTQARAQTPARRIVYYDPDANYQGIVNIDKFFNRFLQDAGGAWHFQPVQSATVFDTLVHEPATAFAIVSSSMLRTSSDVKLTPLLVAVSGGDVYFRKLLVDRGQGDASQYAGKRIAAAVTGEGAAKTGDKVMAVLRESGVGATGAIIIPVPKDIDGLLALSFGQVQAAVVTPASLDVLARLNPTVAKQLRVLVKTRPILRTPLCAVSGHATVEEQRQLQELFANMQGQPDGMQALKVMGIDAWRIFQNVMLEST